MDLTPEPGKDPKRNDLRAEVERLTSLMRTVDLFGTGFVWTDPRTGLEHMLHPADVVVVLRADTQTEFEKIKEAAYRAGREDAAREAAQRAHMRNGRCRYCGRPEGAHRMYCRMYVGPLEHHWVRTEINGTFGGTDYDCVCGGWFRQGGLAGHGDGSDDAEPVCSNAAQDWRGPRAEESGREPAISLGRSEQGDGDSPEEQRP